MNRNFKVFMHETLNELYIYTYIEKYSNFVWIGAMKIGPCCLIAFYKK
jgi:hypothetical protein